MLMIEEFASKVNKMQVNFINENGLALPLPFAISASGRSPL
jgi:hypothetical protein